MAPINLFDLYAKITLDTSDYDDGINEARKSTSTFTNVLKGGLSAAVKFGAALSTAATTGAAAFAKVSLDQYAEYEQLIGGVDTLFKESSSLVQQYAENAYKTAGVSANTYMQQATAFSASLIQSLGGDTEAAAEYANQAIMDMSDNANKMGTDIESIQATYQSLMRGNYEMLDNLKLGYGGTKSELERLVADAEDLTGEALDPAKFSDVIKAIHAVQEEMGITGTTASEAATTIEGSLNSAGAAWENLLAGIADENADVESLVDQFVDSAATAAENIIPRVVTILSGMGTALQQLAPVLSAQIPQIVTAVFPSLISAGAQLIAALVSGLIQSAPVLAATVLQLVGQLVTWFVDQTPQLISTGMSMLEWLVDGIINGIPVMLERIPEVVNSFLNYITENLPQILDKGVELLERFTTGILNYIPDMLAKLPQVIFSITSFITDNLPQIFDSGVQILANLIQGILNAIPDLVAALPELVDAFVNGLNDLMGRIVEVGKNIVQSIIDGIKQVWDGLVEWFNGLWDSVFGSRKTTIEVERRVTGDSIDGSHASGLSYVPFDGYLAELHKGEMVLTRAQAAQLRSIGFERSGLGVASAGIINSVSGNSGGDNSYTFNLVLPDGSKLASYMFRPLTDYARANGTPILNPT